MFHCRVTSIGIEIIFIVHKYFFNLKRYHLKHIARYKAFINFNECVNINGSFGRNQNMLFKICAEKCFSIHLQLTKNTDSRKSITFFSSFNQICIKICRPSNISIESKCSFCPCLHLPLVTSKYFFMRTKLT